MHRFEFDVDGGVAYHPELSAENRGQRVKLRDTARIADARGCTPFYQKTLGYEADAFDATYDTDAASVEELEDALAGTLPFTDPDTPLKSAIPLTPVNESARYGRVVERDGVTATATYQEHDHLVKDMHSHHGPLTEILTRHVTGYGNGNLLRKQPFYALVDLHYDEDVERRVGITDPDRIFTALKERTDDHLPADLDQDFRDGLYDRIRTAETEFWTDARYRCESAGIPLAGDADVAAEQVGALADASFMDPAVAEDVIAHLRAGNVPIGTGR